MFLIEDVVEYMLPELASEMFAYLAQVSSGTPALFPVLIASRQTGSWEIFWLGRGCKDRELGKIWVGRGCKDREGLSNVVVICRICYLCEVQGVFHYSQGCASGSQMLVTLSDCKLRDLLKR